MKLHRHPTRPVARRLTLSLAIAAALAAGFAPVAEAADLAWAPIPSIGNRYWNATVGSYGLSNWVDNSQAHYYRKLTAGDFLIFDGTAYLDNTNDFTDLWVRGFRFQAFAGAFTLGGNPVTLGHGSESSITNTVSSRQTFNMAITVDGTSLWQGGSGGLTFNGAVIVADSSLRLGGGVTINNSDLFVPGTIQYRNFEVGVHGTGTLSIENGSVVNSSGYGLVGLNTGSNGTVTVTGAGSQWNSKHFTAVGYDGTGQLNIEDGGVGKHDTFFVGANTGSNGTVKVSGTGSLLSVTELDVGARGTGTDTGTGVLSILDAGKVTARSLTIGKQGSVNLDGGTLEISGSSVATGGSFNWIKGTLGYTGDARIGEGLLPSGATVGAGNTLKVGGSLSNNKGGLNIENGGVVNSSNGYVGSISASNGSVTVSGAGSQWNNAAGLYIGSTGSGTLSILDAGSVTAQELIIGAKGKLTLDGGTLQISNGSVAAGGSFNWISGSLGYTGDASIGSGLLASSTTTVGAGKSLKVGGNLSNNGGTLNIENGGLVSNNVGRVAMNKGRAAVAVSGAGSQWNNAAALYIGGDGAGTLSILDSGSVTAPNLAIGSEGRITLDGGSLQTTTVSMESGGSFNWIKGSLSFNGDASIGAGLLASTTTVGSGKTLKVIGNLGSNNGTLKIENGGVVSNNIGHIGVITNSKDSVTVSGAGSQWNNVAGLYLGGDGSGTLNILDSGSVAAPDLVIGERGKVNLDGGSLQIANASVDARGIFNWIKGTLGFTGDASIGSGLLAKTTTLGAGKTLNVKGSLSNNNGNLKITNGGVASSATGAIGDAAGSKGAVTVTGATSAWRMSEDLNVGYRGTGSLDVLAGGEVSSNYGFIGREGPDGSVATVSGAGSKWVNSLELYVTNGSLLIRDGGFASSRNAIVGGYPGSKGSVTVTGAGSQWSNSAGLYLGQAGTGTLNILDAGRVSAQALTIGSAGTLKLGQGAQLSTVNGTVNHNAVSFDGDSSIQGNFTNKGSVVASPGSAGTLSFLNDVNGAGSYAGNILFKASYKPGNSPAAVDFGGGDVTFDSSSVLDIELFGSTPGTQYDQLLHIGTLTFNGTLNLIFGEGYVPTAGSPLTLFDFESFAGALTADHITVSGYDKSKLDFSRLALDGSLSVAAVPEPGTYAMLLVGLGLLGGVARRRRAA